MCLKFRLTILKSALSVRRVDLCLLLFRRQVRTSCRSILTLKVGIVGQSRNFLLLLVGIVRRSRHCYLLSSDRSVGRVAFTFLSSKSSVGLVCQVLSSEKSVHHVGRSFLRALPPFLYLRSVRRSCRAGHERFMDRRVLSGRNGPSVCRRVPIPGVRRVRPAQISSISRRVSQSVSHVSN